MRMPRRVPSNVSCRPPTRAFVHAPSEIPKSLLFSRLPVSCGCPPGVALLPSCSKLMPTDSQIQANRRNARKSTGPRSAEGKAASSQNALKTGIDAKSLVIRGEDAATLDALATCYHERFQPATPEQCVLVDALITADWLLRRLRKIEPQLWEIEFQKTREWQRFHKKVMLGDAFTRSQRVFDRLQRRLVSADRAYHRALDALRALRPDCFTPPTPPPAAPPEPVTPVPPPQIGFVPQTCGAGTPACTHRPRRPTEIHENPCAGGVAQALLPAAPRLPRRLSGVYRATGGEGVFEAAAFRLLGDALLLSTVAATNSRVTLILESVFPDTRAPARGWFRPVRRR